MRLLRSLLLLAVAAAASTASAKDAQPAALSDLVAGEASLVADGFRFTEGPAWHPDGYLLFSDIPNFDIVKLEDGETSVWMDESGRCNGIVISADGRIFGCQGGLPAVSEIVASGSQPEGRPLAGEYDGAKLNMPNDLALDSDGGLYFTDPVYGQTKARQPVLGVYYVSESGELTRVIDDLPKPNGILVSTDGRTLYVASPEELAIVAYDITGPGQLANKRTLFVADKSQDGSHGPDGMAIDADGRIYATYQSVVVIEPSGELVGRIAIPEKPANCIFGGDDHKTLYVTARTGLYAVPMTVAGQPLKERGPKPAKATQPTMLEDAATADAEAAEELETFQAGPLTLSVPAGWEKTPPANRLRLAQFSIPAAGDGEPIDAVLSGPFGGSDEQNIARWVAQFQPDGREAKTLTGKRSDGQPYTLVDLSGTYNQPDGPPFLRKTIEKPGSRMLAVILPSGGGNFFLKMAGDAETVAANAAKFRQVFGGDASTETATE